MNHPYVQVGENDQIRVGLALHIVAAAISVHPRQFAHGRLSALRMRRARWLAIYLAHVTYEWSLDHVAHAFGLNRQTASNACQWVEDVREHKLADTLIDQMEAGLRTLIGVRAGELTELRA